MNNNSILGTPQASNSSDPLFIHEKYGQSLVTLRLTAAAAAIRHNKMRRNSKILFLFVFFFFFFSESSSTRVYKHALREGGIRENEGKFKL
jgi:hypothetical protein